MSQVISQTFPQANLLAYTHTHTPPFAWYGKKQPNTTKARIHQSKKLKPGLVACYDIWPGNGAGLFSKEKTSK